MSNKHKKDAGYCPICNKGLAKVKKDLFEKLGLEEREDLETTVQEIKTAFKETAKIHHPDRGGDPELFQEAKEAKEELLKMLEDDNTFSIEPIEQVIKTIPTPIQLQAMREMADKIKATWGGRGACPYCRQ